MNTSDTLHRWLSSWRAAPKVEADDPADMGTAFGLDLSMEEGLPVAPAKAPGAPSQRTQAHRGWALRLGLRRHQAF